MLRDGLADPNSAEARRTGDVSAAFSAAAKVVEAEYASQYLAHATMEPQTCTAWVKPDGLVEVWTSTQDGMASLSVAAQTAGVPLERAEVHKTMLGGGFGRRGASQDFVRQGVTIAMAMRGTPVKMMWSREEDMQHDFYRPASMVKLRASLDAEGKVVAFEAKIACPSILAVLMPARNNGVDFTAVRTLSDMPYEIPNQKIDYAMRNGHVPVGFWRAPGQQNGVYRECFLDELAQAAGRDPLEFRLAMMKAGDKNRLVLEAAARTAGWACRCRRGWDGASPWSRASAATPPASRRSRSRRTAASRCCATWSRSTPATASIPIAARRRPRATPCTPGRAHPSLHRARRAHRAIELPRLPAAADRRHAQGRAGARATGGFWGGHGGPGILPFQAAVLNAVFGLTGKRIRSLPLKKEDLRKA